MANRPKGYGFTAETTRKMDAKYDEDAEQEALQWLDAVLSEQTLRSIHGVEQTQEALKDGIILCKVMNVLSPGAVAKIHPASANKFKHIENIANFLTAAEKYGCHRGDLFQSVYLSEGQNMAAVIGAIHALGRKAQTNNFNGPILGPKEAERNPREFTEEQLKKGRAQLHD